MNKCVLTWKCVYLHELLCTYTKEKTIGYLQLSVCTCLSQYLTHTLTLTLTQASCAGRGCVNRQMIDSIYDCLATVLKSSSEPIPPTNIWNFDETGTKAGYVRTFLYGTHPGGYYGVLRSTRVVPSFLDVKLAMLQVSNIKVIPPSRFLAISCV